MSLATFLQAIGLPPVHTRSVDVNGTAVKINVLELTADQVEGLFVDLRDESGALRTDRQNALRDRLVAAAICDPTGVPHLSVDDVGQVPCRLLAEMVRAALKVNGMGAVSEAEEKKD